MEYEVNGEKVDIPDADILSNFKNDPAYNAEIDRIVAGKTNTFETQFKSESEAAMSQLKSDHQIELDASKAVATGKGNEAMEGLKTQIQLLTDNFKASEQRAADLTKENKTVTVTNEITNALSLVKDPYDKQNLTRDAMSLYDTESGQFKLDSGAMGGLDDVVKQMQGIHPGRFTSKQPNGPGVNGGALTGSNLLQAALGGNMDAKLAYAAEHGQAAYLAEVEKAALKPNP